MAAQKTVIVTGASQGIGAAIVQAFLDRGDAVVYLTEAGHVTGEVLHVDDGAHAGLW